ncbi:MAG: ABC transporter permease [Acidobacteriota bacterium]
MPERRSPLLVVGAVAIAGLAFLALFAPLLAPYDPDEQLDPASAQLRPPGTRLAAVHLAEGRWLLADRIRRDGDALVVERLGLAQRLPLASVTNWRGDGVADQRRFLLGSDRFGRDVLIRVIHGARISLTVAALALALALALGIVVGGVAGAGGAVLDAVLMRGVDALLCFPALLLALAAAAFLQPSTGVVVLLLGSTGWMTLARLVRSEVRALRQREFVVAARSIGVHPAAILARHLLPNALTPVIADAALRIGDLILAEAALSFLGMGVQAPVPSWGNMIADGRDVLSSAWWASAFPGLAIVLTVVAFNLLGDGLRDRLDPHRARSARSAPAG